MSVHGPQFGGALAELAVTLTRLAPGLQACLDHEEASHMYRFALVLEGERSSPRAAPPRILVEVTGRQAVRCFSRSAHTRLLTRAAHEHVGNSLPRSGSSPSFQRSSSTLIFAAFPSLAHPRPSRCGERTKTSRSQERRPDVVHGRGRRTVEGFRRRSVDRRERPAEVEV